MTTGAVAVLIVGTTALLLAVHALFARHDDTAEHRRRLARTALREALRQEQDAHPVDRLDWTPYRRARRAAPSRALWQVGQGGQS